MGDIIAVNGRDALCRVAEFVLKHGSEVSPRGQVTKEVEHLTVKILNPRDALCTGIGANQSTRVVAAEAVQLIGGFSDPRFAIKHAPALAAFTNERGTFDGAYGPRVCRQYGNLIRRLTSDRDTRQAVLSIWNDQDLSRNGSKDYPCTLVLGFSIRKDRLNLSVVMRSNDVNWGFKNDIFQFTQLQLSIANVLGIDVGVYRHTAFSMHIYERDWEWAESLLEDWRFEPILDHPSGVFAHNAGEMMLVARGIAAGYPRAFVSSRSHDWYADALRGGG